MPGYSLSMHGGGIADNFGAPLSGLRRQGGWGNGFPFAGLGWPPLPHPMQCKHPARQGAGCVDERNFVTRNMFKTCSLLVKAISLIGSYGYRHQTSCSCGNMARSCGFMSRSCGLLSRSCGRACPVPAEKKPGSRPGSSDLAGVAQLRVHRRVVVSPTASRITPASVSSVSPARHAARNLSGRPA